jgi:sarcosine oxidase subunit beta
VIRQADAVVIGGGILGASVAHFLTKNEFGVVVLVEKGTICSGATAYSAANVRQHYSNEVGIRLAVRAVEMFRNGEAELGGPVGFVQCGYMVIAPHGQEEALRLVVPEQQRLGVQTELLTTDEIHERYPQLDLDDIALAALETTSGYADPLQTVTSLVRAAQAWGLRLYEGTSVIDIVAENGEVGGVVIDEGEIAAPIVVNAAGPWAASVGAMAGIDYRLALSREHEIVVALPEGFGALPVVSDPGQSIFFRPYGPDKLLVGEGYPKEQEPCDPDTYNRRADEPVVSRMLARLAARVPALDHPQVVKDYAGVYSITDDWYPIVGGEEAVRGYYAAVGGSGHSFKIGPPIGEALADVISGREPRIDISSLAHSRFVREQAFASVWGPGNRA